MGDVRPDSVRLLPGAMKEFPVGTIRFRARFSRALTTVALGALLALGGALVNPPGPAIAAVPAPAPGDESPTRVDPLDGDSAAGLRLPLGLLSVGVLAVAIGGLALEVRHRRSDATPPPRD